MSQGFSLLSQGHKGEGGGNDDPGCLLRTLQIVSLYLWWLLLVATTVGSFVYPSIVQRLFTRIPATQVAILYTAVSAILGIVRGCCQNMDKGYVVGPSSVHVSPEGPYRVACCTGRGKWGFPCCCVPICTDQCGAYMDLIKGFLSSGMATFFTVANYVGMMRKGQWWQASLLATTVMLAVPLGFLQHHTFLCQAAAMRQGFPTKGMYQVQVQTSPQVAWKMVLEIAAAFNQAAVWLNDERNSVHVRAAANHLYAWLKRAAVDVPAAADHSYAWLVEEAETNELVPIILLLLSIVSAIFGSLPSSCLAAHLISRDTRFNDFLATYKEKKATPALGKYRPGFACATFGLCVTAAPHFGMSWMHYFAVLIPTMGLLAAIGSCSSNPKDCALGFVLWPLVLWDVEYKPSAQRTSVTSTALIFTMYMGYKASTSDLWGLQALLVVVLLIMVCVQIKPLVDAVFAGAGHWRKHFEQVTSEDYKEQLFKLVPEEAFLPLREKESCSLRDRLSRWFRPTLFGQTPRN
mmetsp:Transcript_81761/g.212712  ORF Transcript_81761/g.212712 Transcript_81761/m.212712 type:complete len:519 (+) Transcript_81761:37-1593(+)